MGKKGKNKNQTANNQNAPKLESENTDKEIKIQETVTEVPKIEQLKDETVIVETLPLDGNESKEGTLKSKKRRNRKKKNTATENVEELNEEKTENVNQKEELPTENQVVENSVVEPSTDTLKKKRRRNRKKNAVNVGEVQDENVNQSTENENPVEISSEKSGEDTATSQQNTLKRRRNRNKNKTSVNKDQNESIVEAVEKPLEKDLLQKVEEAKGDQTEKPDPQRRGKKQKRFDLSSKKTISDELQERQEREQNEARDHIKKEIAKREKLLETIDLVLDCHKTEVELAKNQQESLKDVKFLSQEAAKPRPLPSSSKPPKQSANKKTSPVEEELVNKIEQVLGMTKLEIKNAQTQKAYVSRLEAEVAKVKQSKDILLGTQSSSVVPTHIQKMAKEMKDISKGEVPKTKEEMIKEIESRDVLMSEINRVLDTTKSEINKVQKQQKIIQNLEVELNKMKEQEVVEKLMVLAEEEEKLNEPPSPPKQSAATASLLDALMANVGKLKEIQAMKEKQKAEQTPSEGSVEPITQAAALESIQSPEKIDDVETKVENNTETSSVAQKQGIEEKSKSPQKDAKNMSNEKKLASPKEGSPKQQKKHPKDQKKEPQKVHEAKSKAEEMKNSENKKDEDLTKIDSFKENHSAEVKKEQLIKENIIEVSEMKAPENLNECKSKIDDVKQEPIKQEITELPKKDQKKKDHNKDKGKNDKEAKNLENSKKTAETNNSTQQKTAISQEEIITTDQKKTESIDNKSDEKLKDVNQVMPVEVKPITSSETVSQELPKNIKANDQKKNDKEHKTSPKNSHKNKNHNKHDKKDALKGVPEVIIPPVTGQKLSMADMLKNAPDPPPEEIIKKPIDDVKVEAPLARPESAIIEVKPSEQIKEMMQPTTKETSDQKELTQDVDKTIKISSEKQEDEIVFVNKEQVEAEIKEEKLTEQDLTDPKNVQRGGFVSPVDNKDAKPLKKDEKQNANKIKSPIKTPPKSTLQKGLDAKAPPNKTLNQKPKLEVQAKINSKPTDTKKTPQSPTKPLSPTTEKNQPKFESASNISIDTPSSPKIETQNLCHDISSSSTDKPKVPPRPDVTKTSNTKPAPRAGNVTNQSTSPIKTKTPSVSKPATTSTAQSQSHAAKPKPTVSQTRQSATSKPPINTKSTNQKPLATPQKVNSTKTATPKPSSSMASATETK